MYHVRLLEELGECTEALSLLDVNSKSRVIVDKTAIMEARGLLAYFSHLMCPSKRHHSTATLQAQI